MRCAFFLLLAASCPAASLVIEPPVIYDCQGVYGKATIRWSGGSDLVQVVVGPSLTPFTGFGGPAGSAETGRWVGDGLEFRLVNSRGEVEALAVARVACNVGDIPGNGIVGSSYYPLEVGNTWIYRTDSRGFTSEYITRRVTGQRKLGARTYAEITTSLQGLSNLLMLVREEIDGTIWRFTGTEADPKEELYLNARTLRHQPFQNALGSFADAADRVQTVGLIRGEQVFVRGVGLARERQDLMTGSSGGFSSSLELVEYQLATGPRVSLSSPRLGVSAESTFLNVSGKQVTNCVIPCYFAACGLGSPVDPPGTYKPCMRTRVEGSAEGDFWTELSLLNSKGEVVFRAPQAPGSGEAVRYVQMPLYSEPNQPLPAGTYTLRARMGRAESEAAVSSIAIEIR